MKKPVKNSLCVVSQVQSTGLKYTYDQTGLNHSLVFFQLQLSTFRASAVASCHVFVNIQKPKRLV